MTTSSSSTDRSVRRRHLSGWRRRAAALLPVPGLLLLTAGTAHADASDALRVAAQLGPGQGAGAVALRLLLLAAMTVTAGAGVAAVAGRGPLPARLPVVAWVSATLVAVGAEIAYLTGASTMTGTLVQALVALAVPVLLAGRPVILAVVALTALLAVGLGSAHSGGAAVLDACWAVAVVVLVGVSLRGMLTGRSALPSGPRPALPSGPRSALPSGPRSAPPAGPRDPDGTRTRRSAASRDHAAGPRPRHAERGVPAHEHPVAAGVRRSGGGRVGDGGTAAPAPRGAVASSRPTAPRATAVLDAPPIRRTEPVRPRVGRPEARRDLTTSRPARARTDAAGAPRWPLRRIAIGAGLVAFVAGAVQTLATGPASLHDLFATLYGLAALVGTVLPAVAAGLWALTGRPAGRDRAVELQRLAVVTTVLAVAAVAALAGLPTPAPGSTPGIPLLRAVDLGGTQVAVLVAPMRPGPNLVQVSGGGYPADGAAATTAEPSGPAGHHHDDLSGPAGLTISAGGAPVPVTSRPGATGGWAVVDIPAGSSELTLRSGPLDVAVPVDVGAAADVAAPSSTALSGPDGPECASALLGGLVARRTGAAEAPMPSCPSEALTAGDAISLRAMTNFIGEHGVGAIRLVSDDSPRAAAAAAIVRDEARRHHVTLTDEAGGDVALVVVGGWTQAVSTLRAATLLAAEKPTYVGGTFLAPWLLTPSVVTQAQSSVLALEFTPQDVGPRQYAATLAATFPGAAPSTSGYLAWVDATRSQLDDRPRLYGAAPVDVPMSSDGSMDGMHGAPDPAAWFPGGTVVPVTGPLAGT